MKRARIVLLFVMGLFAPSFLNAAEPWIAASRSEAIVYFAFTSPPRIERYNLATEETLATIPLSATPTAMTVDEAGIFLGFEQAVMRASLDGADPVLLHTADFKVRTLFTHGTRLYVFNGATTITVLDKNTGQYYIAHPYAYTMKGFSVAPALSKLFARGTKSGHDDILQLPLTATGSIQEVIDSPYDIEFPGAERTYVFPDQTRVTDTAGIVFSADDLTYRNSFAGAFEDLDFYGETPIIARSGKLLQFSQVPDVVASHTPAAAPMRIFVEKQQLFCVSGNINGIKVEVVALPLSPLAPPGAPADPVGLAYVPEAIFVGSDNNVYLLNKSKLTIFRWSLAERAYVSGIALAEAPAYMTFSEALNRIYLGYANGRISRIDLSEGEEEVFFANSAQELRGMVAGDDLLFLSDSVAPWDSHWSYAADGHFISSAPWHQSHGEMVWSSAARKLFVYEFNSSGKHLCYNSVDENGIVSPPVRSLVGRAPARVAPDGKSVLVGTGVFYDATSLAQVDALSNDITDAVWENDVLFTHALVGGQTQVQRWGRNYDLVDTTNLPGTPYRLFSTPYGLLSISKVDGVLSFTLLTPDFQPAPFPSEANRAVGDFDGDGCTGLSDFMFLVDYWGFDIAGAPVDLLDLFHLLDHWMTGPAC